MKTLLYVASAALFLMACSKNKFDPNNPKDGQQLELFLDHYTSGSDQKIFLNSDRKIDYDGTYLTTFPEREPGYTYVVKARVVEAPANLADAPRFWFEYEQTVHKEKYLGKDTFALVAFAWTGVGDGLVLRKENDKLLYGQQLLTPADAKAKVSLDSAFNAWLALTIAGRSTYARMFVQHAPDNNGYVVYGIR